MSGVIDLDEIAGAKSVHKFARLSASKVRVVLDLVRDEDLDRARDILEFCDRGAADIVSKVLESAVSNAQHNEHLDPEELYVAECWADEGPTLKRWRPRARGRATRINKQTCHVTVVVAQLDEDELAMRAEREAAAGNRGAAAARAARVAASRGEDAQEADDADDTADEAVLEGEVDEAAREEWEGQDADQDEQVNAEDETPYGEGSLAPPADGSIPEGFEIKGNADSMKYHQPDGRWYEQTVAEVFFATTEAAEAAGFIEAGTSEDTDTEETEA
jgi:large subunit ribosomal protein L22